MTGGGVGDARDAPDPVDPRGLSVAGLVIAIVTGWGALVLFYLAPGPETVRTTLAWSFAALGPVTVGASKAS